MKGTEFKPTCLVHNKDGVVCTVMLVKDTSIIARNLEDRHAQVVVSIEDAVPINLTEPILSSAGFNKTSQEKSGGAERWVLETDNGRWHIDFDGEVAYFEVQGKNIKIKYLHHLQCLFLDLGEELDVAYWKPTENELVKLQKLLKTKELCQSGYAGVSKEGKIVDRREFPDATPMQRNPVFNTPKPKKVKT